MFAHVLMALSLAPAPATLGTGAAPDRPTGVILIIADGMGPSMLSTVAEMVLAERGPLVVESMPVVGLVRTASANSAITDSAASSTAMATGHKANNAAIGWFPDGATHPTLIELAEERGMATGLLTTADLTDATPAAWIARVPDRNLQGGIFEQMIASTVDILAGGLHTVTAQAGGPAQTRPAPGVAEGPALAPSVRRAATEAGYAVVAGMSDLPSATGEATRVLVPLDRREAPFGGSGPMMAETLGAALAMLATDPDGFFVMAEVGEPDNAGHGNDTDRAVRGVVELDDTLRAALEFQKTNPGVLVLLTSDHDTGGMNLDNGAVYTGPGVSPVWVSRNHTASRVMIFAKGPGQERFGGSLDNTQIFVRLGELLGLD